MTSVCFITVYIGKLPSYLDLWLTSCKNNPTIDFLLMGDDDAPLALPDNVKYEKTDMAQLKERFQALFDFEISLERPYKLCDFKTTYGEAFADKLKGYGFWGHCDIDMIFGDLRHFLPEPIFEAYDKIFTGGACTLYRNTPEVCSKYRTLDPQRCSYYKDVFSSPYMHSFDEWGHTVGGMTAIFHINQEKQYCGRYHIDCTCEGLIINPQMDPEDITFPPIHNFIFSTISYNSLEGHLRFLAINKLTGKLEVYPISYIHFNDKQFRWRTNNRSAFSVIYPNVFFDYIEPRSAKELKRLLAPVLPYAIAVRLCRKLYRFAAKTKGSIVTSFKKRAG